VTPLRPPGAPWADDVLGTLRSRLRDGRLQRVLAALAQSLDHDVRDLAALVNLSPSRLSRVFRGATGERLGDLIIELRLSKAAQLLESTDEPVKCIAAAVGYNHSSSFVRAFSGRFAANPRAYRRRAQPRLDAGEPDQADDPLE
jgi:transcriptional regulator GlxA family with amidase domain